jgi:uncharacterized membrane protein
MGFLFLVFLWCHSLPPCCARFIHIMNNYLIPFLFVGSVIYTLSMFGLLLFFWQPSICRSHNTVLLMTYNLIVFFLYQINLSIKGTVMGWRTILLSAAIAWHWFLGRHSGLLWHLIGQLPHQKTQKCLKSQWMLMRQKLLLWTSRKRLKQLLGESMPPTFTSGTSTVWPHHRCRTHQRLLCGHGDNLATLLPNCMFLTRRIEKSYSWPPPGVAGCFRWSEKWLLCA